MPNNIALQLMEDKTGVKISKKSKAIPHIGSSGTSTSSIDLQGWLVHLGRLTRERVSEELLDAVKKAHEEFSDKFNGLMLVGDVCHEFREMVKLKEMTSLIRYRAPVNHQEAIAITLSAPCLLVIEANMNFSPFLPSKFADYAFAGQPMIALSPPVSPIREYLRNLGGGLVVSHNKKDIFEAINMIFSENNIDENLFCNKKLKDHFSSKTVAKEYIEMFDQTLATTNKHHDN